MTDLASHPQPAQPSPHEISGGLEIIEGLDSHLAEQGIVRVEGIKLIGSGRAVYEINRSVTDGSLDEAMKRELVDPQRAADLTIDALRVINEMYRMDLDAHGDIRPQNILVDEIHHTAAIGGFHTTDMGERALEAFGLDVSHIISRNPDGEVDITFTAPEVVTGSAPDKRSDVYEGAGTILYALSGGRTRSTVRYFDDVQGESYVPAPAPDLSVDFPTGTPDSVRFALHQALSPNPEERQSMGQLVAEITSQVYPVSSQQAAPQALNN